MDRPAEHPTWPVRIARTAAAGTLIAAYVLIVGVIIIGLIMAGFAALVWFIFSVAVGGFD